jgi:hypothetical protein
MSQPGIRASDAEREHVAVLLRDHCAEGRLTLDELDERLDRVYKAGTRRELDLLVADLPVTATKPADGGRRRFFWPGVSAFHERRRLQADCRGAYEQALREMVPRMSLRGYQLVGDVPPRRLVFADQDGLVVTVMFHQAAGAGTDVSAFGVAPRAVRKAFATLTD